MTKQTLRDEFQALAGKQDIKHTRKISDDIRITVKGLTVDAPGGERTLIKDANFTLSKGDKYALTGDNGAGKSSLFRVFGRLWNFGEGDIEIEGPQDMVIQTASQKSRMPDRMLDGILAYPYAPDHFTPEQYEAVLDEAEFPEIKVQLPWNAAKPESVMAVCEKAIVKLLENNVETIRPNQKDAFMRGVEHGLKKKFAVPRMLEPYLSEEARSGVMDQTTALVRDNLDDVASGKHSYVFPERKGRKLGEKVGNEIHLSMSRWLLHGAQISLSGGEAQKLIFARLFLQKPDVLFLDEITSDLRENTAHRLYKKLMDQTAHGVVMAINHNDSLLVHHTHHMDLADQKLTIRDVSQAEVANDAGAAQDDHDAGKPEPGVA